MATNPFYFRELPTDGPFCDREREQEQLVAHARALAHVVLYSPRRFGKTSLVRRVQATLGEEGAVPVYVHFFGITSVEDFAARLARAVFEVTHKRESLFQKTLRTFRSFRPSAVFEPDADKGVTMSVEIVAAKKRGIELLEDVMESLDRFVDATDGLVHVVFDEFQEITELPDALAIEGVLRGHIQRQPAAYCFVGSRRRILLGIFNDRQRPFFRSAINYELPPLPREEFATFLADLSARAGRPCATEVGLEIVDRVRGFPYYAQKLAYFAFGLADRDLTARDVARAFDVLLKEERPALEGYLLAITPTQTALLTALAAEPTKALYAHDYVHRHRLVSGSVRKAKQRLVALDLIERTEDGTWRVVDPLLEAWLGSNLGV